MKDIKDYPYLYETHLHTCQGSACARNTGSEMAEAVKKAGYTGIIVTEHNWGGNSCVGRADDAGNTVFIGKENGYEVHIGSHTWREWVTEFSKGYLDAKAYGDANDLDVFFGYEAGFKGTEFLIYGVDIEWMLNHPELRSASVEEQYRLVHEAGGMVVHAHPFRDEPYIPEIRLFPDYVDAVEGINATHSNPASVSHNKPEFDERAIEYANSHKLPMTAGSDIHSISLFGGGVLFKRRLTSVQDYCRAILNGEDYILTDGHNYFDKYGRKT